MRFALRSLVPYVLLSCWTAVAATAHAQDDTGWETEPDHDIVSVGHDAMLGRGETARSVVSVFGSASADGDVSESVVAVVGDTRVSGRVGDSAVAVLGNVYVNSKISGNVVAVAGNVTLGPQAEVSGQVVEIMGTIDRNPSAVVEGGTVGILSGLFGNIGGLHAWIHRCLLYARPLAPDVDMGWAWGIALAALAFYLLLAAVFPDSVQRCVQTLEAHPGPSILAALIAIVLVPVLMLVLVMTVVGIAVIPFFWLGMFCVGIFGRAVALGWLGGRCLALVRAGVPLTHAPARAVLAVLVGGGIALVLYMIPLLGFITYAVLGLLGFGAVVYTLLLAAKATRGHPAPGAPQFAPSGPASGTGSPGGASPPPHTGGPPPGGSPASGHTAAVDPLTAATLPRAGFWPRMGALALDLVLVGFALSLFYHHGFRGTLLILATYAAIMWKLRSTTIGGIVFGLQVARLDGRPIDWGTAIVRALACFLSLAIVGLGFLWIAFDPEHQAWHDKIAGTVVVRVAKGVALV